MNNSELLDGIVLEEKDESEIQKQISILDKVTSKQDNDSGVDIYQDH